MSLFPDEHVEFESELINLLVETKSEGRGKLFITDKRVIWEGLSVFIFRYQDIALHAISGGSTDFPYPHIFMQLSNATEEDNEEEGKELRFSSEAGRVEIDEIFLALNKMSALNPDEDFIDSENEWTVADSI